MRKEENESEKMRNFWARISGVKTKADLFFKSGTEYKLVILISSGWVDSDFGTGTKPTTGIFDGMTLAFKTQFNRTF